MVYWSSFSFFSCIELSEAGNDEK